MDTLHKEVWHSLDINKADLEFLGLQGMIDPPRQEAIEAVEASHKAGILVKMITGDHAGTAAAIAKQLGLCGESCSYHTREVLTGADIAGLPDEKLTDQQVSSCLLRFAISITLRRAFSFLALNHFFSK